MEAIIPQIHTTIERPNLFHVAREIEKHGVPTDGKPRNSKAWSANRWQPKKFNGLECQPLASSEIQWHGVKPAGSRRNPKAWTANGWQAKKFNGLD